MKPKALAFQQKIAHHSTKNKNEVQTLSPLHFSTIHYGIKEHLRRQFEAKCKSLASAHEQSLSIEFAEVPSIYRGMVASSTTSDLGESMGCPGEVYI
jgi:hypothetical protein